MKLRTWWGKQKNWESEADVMRDGLGRGGTVTPQEYLLNKLHDNFDAHKECIAFIDKKRDENKNKSN